MKLLSERRLYLQNLGLVFDGFLTSIARNQEGEWVVATTACQNGSENKEKVVSIKL